MNGEIAFAGCPPDVSITKGEFSRLPTGKQAAFTDGVVRGSYEQDWLIRQNNVTLPDSTLKKMDSSSVGALAYVYLKTGNRISLKNLERWVEIHRDDNTIFD